QGQNVQLQLTQLEAFATSKRVIQQGNGRIVRAIDRQLGKFLFQAHNAVYMVVVVVSNQNSGRYQSVFSQSSEHSPGFARVQNIGLRFLRIWLNQPEVVVLQCGNTNNT